MYDKNNIFAKILRGENDCKKIYENDYALALYDKFPKAKIHALVICKGYYVDLNDFLCNATANEKEGFLSAIKETINILNIANKGYKIINNNGKNAEQEVPHLHFHIISK